MQPQFEENTTGSLEKARARLYQPAVPTETEQEEGREKASDVSHEWGTPPLIHAEGKGHRHIRLAGIFFIVAGIFFVVSVATAGYFFYFGSNTVSVNKVAILVEGPVTVSSGDSVSLLFTITNRNPVALKDAVLEVSFPEGTRSADDVLATYPRYSESLGEIQSGETITRTLRAIVFGAERETLAFLSSLSYGMTGSNATFVKKYSYAVDVSSAPLSVSLEAPSETVSGKPFEVKFIVRSNAPIPLENVVLATTIPFGFSFISSSLPFENNSFTLGTLAPGTSREIILSGALLGQDKEERTFEASIGTARSATDRTPSIVYMTQRTTLAIAAPFLRATLSLNGNTAAEPVLLPGRSQSAALSYTNTLDTNVQGATLEVALSGSGINYDSVRTTQGFYRSSDRTIIFSSDTDSSLSLLAPGASGIGSFSFETLPAGQATSPSVTFALSVSGTRVGQIQVPERVESSSTKTARVATSVSTDIAALRTSGPFANTGAFPPRVDQPTTYTIVLRAKTDGSAVAGGAVKTSLPGSVTYTGQTAGSGTVSYDSTARSVTWNVGDLGQGEAAEAFFQISFTPSIAQKATAPALTGATHFSAHDRFAGVAVSASGNPATTATTRDPGYSSVNAIVQ